MPETILNKNISEFWTPERCFIQEILNDPSHPNSSLAVARVPPGVTTQLHRLNGTEETYIIKRGDGVLEIDGEKSELQLGDAIIIPAGASQKISNIGDEDLESDTSNVFEPEYSCSPGSTHGSLIRPSVSTGFQDGFMTTQSRSMLFASSAPAA